MKRIVLINIQNAYINNQSIASLPLGRTTVLDHLIRMFLDLDIDTYVIDDHDNKDKFSLCVHSSNEFDAFKEALSLIEKDFDQAILLPIRYSAISKESYCLLFDIDSSCIQMGYDNCFEYPLFIKKEMISYLYKFDDFESFISSSSITRVNLKDKGLIYKVEDELSYHKTLEYLYDCDIGYPIYPKVTVMLNSKEKMLGPGTYQLLMLIDKLGSLQKACDDMELSYSKGSKMVKRVEKQLGYPVVVRWSGGINGGGSSLSEEGRIFLEKYHQLFQDVEEFTNNRFNEIFMK